jgi:uncharacterized membrane protein YkvA (DUF1232 family)
MSQTDTIRAIITEQSSRDGSALFLVNAVRSRMGSGASQAEVHDAVGFCRDIITSVPVLIDRVREAAEANGVAPLVEPVLAHAERYFLLPVDALPEALLGELGLLDDAYLALSVIRLVQSDEQPLIEIDLTPPLSFLEKLLGDDVLEQLQAEKTKAFESLLAAAHAMAAEGEARQRRQAAAQRQQQARSQPQRPSQPSPTSGAPTARRQQCAACSGSGSITCSSCGGYGSHTRSSTRIDWQGHTEYVSEQVPCGCSGGRQICGRCGGAGYAVVLA